MADHSMSAGSTATVMRFPPRWRYSHLVAARHSSRADFRPVFVAFGIDERHAMLDRRIAVRERHAANLQQRRPARHCEQCRAGVVRRRRAYALARPDDRNAERFLVKVVDRRASLAELPFGESGEAQRRQCDVVDDDRDAVEPYYVANPDDGVARLDRERFSGHAIGFAARECLELHFRILLRTVLRHDVKEVEHLALAIVAGDEGAATLL